MRNIHKQLITTIIPSLLCIFVMPASAEDLDSVESIAAVCRFSEPAGNPFLAPEADRIGPSNQVPESEAYSSEAYSSEDEPAAHGDDVETEQSAEMTGRSRRVYSARSANTQVRAEIEVYRGDEAARGERAHSPLTAARTSSNDRISHTGALQGQAIDGADGSESSVTEAESAMRYAQSRRRQLSRTYETVVESSQFRVVSYDPASETLVVSLSDPLELNGGVAAVSMDDDNTLMFAVNAEAADYIETQWRTGAVELWLRYELISRQDMERPYCKQNEMGGPELVGALLEATLIESLHNRTLASMETERAVRERCSLRAEAPRAGQSDNPRLVDVHTLESFGADTMSEAEATMLTVFAELVLGECFFDAQISNAALEGAVVVNFEFAPDGTMNEARLTIDALRSEQFRTCAIDAFSRSRIPRMVEASALDTRMTLIFSPAAR